MLVMRVRLPFCEKEKGSWRRSTPCFYILSGVYSSIQRLWRLLCVGGGNDITSNTGIEEASMTVLLWLKDTDMRTLHLQRYLLKKFFDTRA